MKENSKSKKITMIVCLTLLAVLLITIVAVAGYAFVQINGGLSDMLVCDEFFAEWQDDISDDAKINKVVTPGSHDAGSFDMMPLAKTQGHSIADQLRGGARYFDLRVTNKGDDLVIFHGPIKGQKFSIVLDEIKAFTIAHPSEFLILDFQHLGDKVHQKTIDAITGTLNMQKAMLKSVFGDVSKVTMGDIRAHGFNFMIVWSDDSQVASNDFLYTRDKDLTSQYDSKFHKKKPAELIAHFETYFENHTRDDLFVLQSQRTAPTLLGKPAKLELEFRPYINEFVSNLKTSKHLDEVNIIMRDFVVSDMQNVKLILQLNLVKGLVKADEIESFTAKTI